MKKTLLTVLAAPLLLTSCVTVYGNLNAGPEKTVTLFSASCHGTLCAGRKEMICTVASSGDLDCVDLAASYANK